MSQDEFDRVFGLFRNVCPVCVQHENPTIFDIIESLLKLFEDAKKNAMINTIPTLKELNDIMLGMASSIYDKMKVKLDNCKELNLDGRSGWCNLARVISLFGVSLLHHGNDITHVIRDIMMIGNMVVTRDSLPGVEYNLEEETSFDSNIDNLYSCNIEVKFFSSRNKIEQFIESEQDHTNDRMRPVLEELNRYVLMRKHLDINFSC